MIQASTSAVGMNGRKTGKEQIRKLTLAAMLTAVVVVLALLATAIRVGVFNINLALVPIVIGAAMLGVWYGAWFGFVNAMVILLSGDATMFFTFNVAGTVITVLLKGILAGLFAGAVYSLVSSKNKYAAVLLAALVCPIVNTGIFVLGCRVFFWEHIPAIAEIIGVPLKSRSNFIFAVLVGLNFPTELVVNIVLAPAIARILGFSEDKNISMITYGAVLAVVGVAALIFSLVLLNRAAAGENLGVEKPETRYLVMAIASGIVLIGGSTLTAFGVVHKKKSAG